MFIYIFNFHCFFLKQLHFSYSVHNIYYFYLNDFYYSIESIIICAFKDFNIRKLKKQMLILQLFEAKLKSCEKDKEKINNTSNAEKNKKSFIEKNDINNNTNNKINYETEDLILKNINERNILIT
jgi:hypothetical protein